MSHANGNWMNDDQRSAAIAEAKEIVGKDVEQLRTRAKELGAVKYLIEKHPPKCNLPPDAWRRIQEAVGEIEQAINELTLAADSLVSAMEAI